jgi:hypothetical protein
VYLLRGECCADGGKFCRTSAAVPGNNIARSRPDKPAEMGKEKSWKFAIVTQWVRQSGCARVRPPQGPEVLVSPTGLTPSQPVRREPGVHSSNGVCEARGNKPPGRVIEPRNGYTRGQWDNGPSAQRGQKAAALHTASAKPRQQRRDRQGEGSATSVCDGQSTRV